MDCERMTGNSSTIGLSKTRRLLAWSLPVATQIHPSANRSRMLTQTSELMDGRASLEEIAHTSSRLGDVWELRDVFPGGRQQRRGLAGAQHSGREAAGGEEPLTRSQRRLI